MNRVELQEMANRSVRKKRGGPKYGVKWEFDPEGFEKLKPIIDRYINKATRISLQADHRTYLQEDVVSEIWVHLLQILATRGPNPKKLDGTGTLNFNRILQLSTNNVLTSGMRKWILENTAGMTVDPDHYFPSPKFPDHKKTTFNKTIMAKRIAARSTASYFDCGYYTSVFRDNYARYKRLERRLDAHGTILFLLRHLSPKNRRFLRLYLQNHGDFKLIQNQLQVHRNTISVYFRQMIKEARSIISKNDPTSLENETMA